MDQAIVTFMEKKVNDLKENEELDCKMLEYQRALSETLLILKGSDDMIHFDKLMVIDWKEEYGACILLKPRTFDPVNGLIYLVGLDGWTFTVNSGEHTALAGDDPAFLYAGIISMDKVNDFLNLVNQELSKVAGKKGNDRHSSNLDGGHQKTPGFLYSKCVDVLNGLKSVKELQIHPQNSGFTDVSMHTGCTKRETKEPLTFSLIKTVLKLGMVPRVTNAEGCFVRFCTEYHLQLALEVANKSPISDYADQAMMHLSDASKYGVLLADSRFWPDTDSFSAKFVEIRKILEVGLESEKASNSEQYQTYIPNLNDMELLPSPKIIVEKIPVSDLNEEGNERALLTKSKINLNWIPFYDLKTLNDCRNLLNDDRISALEPYFFSIVHVQVEKFLFGLARAYLKEDSNTHIECDSAALISVVESLCEKIAAFSSKQNSFLNVELKSHIALMKWLKFCILFELGVQTYKTLSNYAPALDFRDLEHLVLRDKNAWDCVDLISNYLERRRQVSGAIVFSGRPEEVTGTFDFADKFVNDTDHRSQYDQLLSQERAYAESRIDNRWAAIKKKKKECDSIRQQIALLQENLVAATSARDSHKRNIWCDYNEYYFPNPDWKRYDNQCNRIADQIRAAWVNHAKIKRAPPYLKQSLPKPDDHAKRALFFCYMPQLLRDIWSECYEAQRAIFLSKGANSDLSQLMNFHEFYDGPYDFREKKESIHTPLLLYCHRFPKDFGSYDVEIISSRDDGVWYPAAFQPEIIWKHGNPFTISRNQAVSYFTEQIANEKLQWAAEQRGGKTPSNRGNLAIARLYEKPDNLTREQFITFGNIRAFPLLQIMNVLDSLARMTLPLKFCETHQLIQLVFYHLGKLDCSDELGAVKSWKEALYDKQVISRFQSVLEIFIDRLKDAPKNHHEFLIGIEIISFLSQFAPGNFVSLADTSSNIATNWANNMDQEIMKSRNTSNAEILQGTQAKQHLFLLYAVLAYEMVPSFTPDQVKKILSLIVRINATLILDEITMTKDNNVQNLKSSAKKLICRVNFILARSFHSWVFEDDQLTEAARIIFPGRVENHMKWTKLDGRYCYYTKNSDGYYISLNVLNGTTLLNGEPPGRLPLDVLNHPLYLKVFGKNQNFTTELEYDGTKKTIYPSKGRYYSFKSIQNHLLVFEEEPSTDMILKLRLLDSANIDKWGQHLPIGL